MRGLVPEEFNKRVFIDKNQANKLFSDYSSNFDNATQAAQSLGLNLTTYLKYTKGESKTYPLEIVKEVCDYLNEDSSDYIINNISLKTLRGDSNRGNEPKKKFKGKNKNKTEIDSMMNDCRNNLKKKYGKDCYKQIGKLSLEYKEDLPNLYSSAEHFFNKIKSRELTLDELIEDSMINEKYSREIVNLMFEEKLIELKNNKYYALTNDFLWKKELEITYNLLDKPMDIKDLKKNKIFADFKLNMLLYELKNLGKVNYKLDSKTAYWYKSEHEDSPYLLNIIQKKILSYLKFNPNKTNKEIREVFNFNRRTLIYHLNQLLEKKYISSYQKARNFFYEIKKDIKLYPKDYIIKLLLGSKIIPEFKNKDDFTNFLVFNNLGIDSAIAYKTLKKEDYIFEMKDNKFKTREEEIVYSVLMNFYSIGFADMKLFFNESYMNNVLKEDIKKFVFSLKNFDYVNEWIAKNKQTYSNL
ncbi:MAG: winged helix-turn-helix transcriptional regulator, partial [Candidatus Nanoarchaeia archaeon]|nr:winged helix-turn-helix transcriptional regulator [Candidatus Nanoarchaeia archaeon]